MEFKGTYYIQNSKELDKAIKKIKKNTKCSVTREYIEMDYSEVTVVGSISDGEKAKYFLATLV